MGACLSAPAAQDVATWQDLEAPGRPPSKAAQDSTPGEGADPPGLAPVVCQAVVSPLVVYQPMGHPRVCPLVVYQQMGHPGCAPAGEEEL